MQKNILNILKDQVSYSLQLVVIFPHKTHSNGSRHGAWTVAPDLYLLSLESSKSFLLEKMKCNTNRADPD